MKRTGILLIALLISLISSAEIIISEIHYNPQDELPILGSDLEFLEVTNTGNSPINVSGYFFSSGISYTFPSGSNLPAGASWIIARNKAVLESFTGLTVYGQYVGGLRNSGETLTLLSLSLEEVFSVSYLDNTPWPVLADGVGKSLEYTGSGEPNNPSSWKSSSEDGGSPNTFAPSTSSVNFTVRVNEVSANPTLNEDEKIELFNFGNETIDLSGWYLTDDRKAPKKFKIPSGTMIAPNSYLAFNRSDYGFSFGLSAKGEQAYLFSAENDELTGFATGFSFDVTDLDQSYGVITTSLGENKVFALKENTFENENSEAQVGPLVITNIMYDGGGFLDEFIAVTNTSDSVVSSNSPYLTDSNGIKIEALRFQFDFNNPVSFSPGESFIVTPAVPEDFRNNYGLSSEIKIFQCQGGLNGISERIAIELPVKRDTTLDLNGTEVYIDFYKTLDEVEYSNSSPWYPDANGTGKYLIRKNNNAYANDPAVWLETNMPLLSTNDSKKLDFEIYPTIVKDIITIKTTSKDQPYTVLTPEGDEVKTGNLNNENRLELASLASGIYIIRIGDTAKKIIKL